jgi:hypothetical protein
MHIGPNALAPERMSTSGRLAELAAILALGVVRLKAAKSSGQSECAEKSSLDFNANQSGVHHQLSTTENFW